MILGLLAPELVVWNAWRQRKRVKKLSSLMKEKGFMPERLSMWKRTRDWFAETWRDIRIVLLLEAGSLPEFRKPEHNKCYNGHQHAWTDIHSWFAVMGGLAFQDSSPDGEQFMPGQRQRITLTSDGLAWLAKHRPQLVPEISRESILDKSKSDWLAKAFTCWQASYFCIQCVYRLSQRL
jgi:hypothetical protein